MSLSTILKAVGKDLSHVGGWIDDGLKVASEVAGVVDPPLGAIFTSADAILEKLLGTSAAPTINASQLQAIVTAISLLQSLKLIPATPAAPAPAAPAAPAG